MTLTEIKNAVAMRLFTQTTIPKEAIQFPNKKAIVTAGRDVWVQLTATSSMGGAKEIGNGAVVQRGGVIIIRLYVPLAAEVNLLYETADKLRELFEFKTDGSLDYFAVDLVDGGEVNGFYQMNLHIPYRAL
ncbi:phage tail terminator-like protein [Moellerella wisconsensis]|uniref:Phage tail terminator-like protein n=1 Tax=Moellerella wisconsensis TaxID=158849 RepID=A0ACD3YAB5_9GAMM|nr:phage tail terminator-like protein [Moellerella wisconsensis]UNH39976.1 phage tail terminator-like protein [Moellerella wisconsensis]